MSRRTLAAVLVVLAAALVGALRSSATELPGDFLRYHRAGRMVVRGDAAHLYDVQWLRAQRVYAEERAAEKAERGADADPYAEYEFKYVPAMACLMAPLGALHPRTAVVLWGAWNAALLALLVIASWRAAALLDVPRVWLLVPLAVLARSINDNQNLGQLNPSAIVPATLGLLLVARRRDVAGGALLAWGAVVKYMPVFLLPWLLWKRCWRAAATCVVGIVVLAAGLPALVFGPRAALELHRTYVDVRAHHFTSSTSPDLPGHSIKSFLYRVFGTTHYKTGAGPKAVDIDVSLVHLPPPLLQWGTLALAALVLAWVLRRSGRALRPASDPGSALEHGLALAWLLLASPEARAPHFLYETLLACAAVALLVRAWRTPAPRPRALVVATVCAVLWAVLHNLDTSKLGRFGNTASALCALGWGTAALMTAAVLAARVLATRDAPADAAPLSGAPAA